MMNRRSILSTLCTGALALLAPVVAWAKPRRWVGFHNRGVKPMVITPREGSAVQQCVTDWRHVDWSDEKATLVVRASYLKTLHEAALDHHQTILQLRDLLAEARDLLTPIVPFKRKDGTLTNFTQVHADDITGFVRRADAALKGHEHA